MQASREKKSNHREHREHREKPSRGIYFAGVSAKRPYRSLLLKNLHYFPGVTESREGCISGGLMGRPYGFRHRHAGAGCAGRVDSHKAAAQKQVRASHAKTDWKSMPRVGEPRLAPTVLYFVALFSWNCFCALSRAKKIMRKRDRRDSTLIPQPKAPLGPPAKRGAEFP